MYKNTDTFLISDVQHINIQVFFQAVDMKSQDAGKLTNVQFDTAEF